MTLAWEAFERLPGSPDRNLELLIRSLVRRRWGRFGLLRDRLNQPGIEFHLELHDACELGEAGRWFGWQCRYYELGQRNQLGVRRRDEIRTAVEKAKEDVPGLTDFVLCLKALPSAGDLAWYDGELQVEAPNGVRLHRWATDDIEAYLADDALALRQTYFGELVLTPEILAAAHERSIAPIRRRWVPELHVMTDVERQLEASLLRPGCAVGLAGQAAVLAELDTSLGPADERLSEPDRALHRGLAGDLRDLAGRLQDLATACEEHRAESAAELLAGSWRPRLTVRQVDGLARRLRSLGSPSAPAASTAIADVRRGLRLIAQLHELSAAPAVAVVGAAGRGKSHLSAQLTAPHGSVPAGVFIRAVELRSGGTLDDLASRVPGLPVSTFEDLLEACDAAAARAGDRLPIVIDGLNESQRPEEWADLLVQIVPILGRYANVRLILTYRGAVAEAVRTAGVREIAFELDRLEVGTAIGRYFHYFKIDSRHARLPFGLFRDLLFLRLFCETANPDAREWVGAEALPQSLVAVFERYVAQAADRIRRRPGHPSWPAGHVERKLAAFAIRLWEASARHMPWRDSKLLFDGSEHEWDNSLLRALEEEGLLYRDDGAELDEPISAVLFDRLGGYLVADALIGRVPHQDAADALRDAELWRQLRGRDSHPLGEDVLASLVGLVPRRGLGQLWRLCPAERRRGALLAALDIESEHLDDSTLDALAAAIPTVEHGFGAYHPFSRLWELRDAPEHRLNAGFLDRVLRPLGTARRDLVWTEWVRTDGQIADELEAHRRQWEQADERDDGDQFAALALGWLLTSTVMPLRDAATRALQRFGQADPGRLFGVASALLAVNDPYVSERVLAAAYGAVMTHQMPDPGSPFERALRSWLDALATAYLGPDAHHPTSHQLIRAYVRGCFEFAAALHPMSLPDGIDAQALPFAPGPHPEPIPEEDDRHDEVDSTMRMDFANYTVGGLFADRANYQYDHPAYVAGLAQVRGRIWELGWRQQHFGRIDELLGSDRRGREDAADRTERYGKKYGWIAYYELAGRLADAGAARPPGWARPRDGVWPDIDPSFTPSPGQLRINLTDWATSGPADPATWLRSAEISVPDELLAPRAVDGDIGPWLLVEGYLRQAEAVRARIVWGFVRGVLVAEQEHDALVDLLTTREYLGNHLIRDAPASVSVFAGEIPWSRRFIASVTDGDEPPYVDHVGGPSWDEGIEVELLGHGYDFAASRTTTVELAGHDVPSYAFAQRFDLRQWPGALDLVALDGQIASRSLRAPEGWEGHLLYLRADLLKAYAGDRRLVQLAWGEREVRLDRYWDLPEWLRRALEGHGNLWRRIRSEPAT